MSREAISREATSLETTGVPDSDLTRDTCRDLLITDLARALGRSPGDLKLSTIRPPAEPVSLGAIAGGDKHEK